MATILQMRENLLPLRNKKEIEAILMQEVARFSHILVDLQQERLEKGRDTLGNIIGRYSRATEGYALFGDVKPIMPKKAGEPFNFQWTGGWFDGMYVKADSKKAVFGSKDPVTKELELRYSDLYGLDHDGQVEFVSKYLYPAFMAVIKKRLALR